jgi:hypothetical protein
MREMEFGEIAQVSGAEGPARDIAVGIVTNVIWEGVSYVYNNVNWGAVGSAMANNYSPPYSAGVSPYMG